MTSGAAAGTGLLSLVIPAYNETACLARNVATILAHVDEAGLSAELLIVDDGSTDDTRAVAEGLAAGDARVRTLANPENAGKGSAVRQGMLAAGGDPVVFLDADLSTPIATLQPMLAAFAAGADVVVGSRRVAAAQIAVHQPWLREFLGRGFTWLTRLWLRVPLADFTCGFKGFRAHAVRPIFERQQLDDWSFDAEICYLARRFGYSIAQVPVVWSNDPESKVRVGAALFRSVLGLWRIRWWGLTGRYRP